LRFGSGTDGWRLRKEEQAILRDNGDQRERPMRPFLNVGPFHITMGSDAVKGIKKEEMTGCRLASKNQKHPISTGVKGAETGDS